MLTAIGMMSGTSMDGIDVALLRSDGSNRLERGPAGEYPYDAAFRHQLEQALEDATRIEDRNDRPGNLSAIEAEITNRHHLALEQFLTDHKISKSRIDLIGFHGQTVLHRPREHLTVQLGDGRQLATLSGLPIVYDMRAADMKAAGQGAPLAPAYHKLLGKNLPLEFAAHDRVVFVNIGGISNITCVSRNNEPLAFDTGPGNALIDQWVHARADIAFDKGGSLAAAGKIVPEIVTQYLAESFFQKPVPKSLDRKDFLPLEPARANLEDGARSLVRVSTEAILKACDHLPDTPQLWVVSGGGRKNRTILSDLATLAEERGLGRVVTAEEAGFDGDAMEAEAWAFLAIRSKLGLPLTFPGTTGCNAPNSGGVLALPA